MKISIVLPVYNEEKNIPILYTELSKVLLNLKDEYEIIWVDDASKDKSLEVLRAIALGPNCGYVSGNQTCDRRNYNTNGC
jgi:glycosyltransferase involved in cell wall biosynthesis